MLRQHRINLVDDRFGLTRSELGLGNAGAIAGLDSLASRAIDQCLIEHSPQFRQSRIGQHRFEDGESCHEAIVQVKTIAGNDEVRIEERA